MLPIRRGRPNVIALIAYAECAIIVLPLLLLFASSFTTTRYLVFPPQGLTLHWYNVALQKSPFLHGTIISLQVAALSSILAVALGIIAGRELSRADTRFKRSLNALFLAPLTIPGIVFSIAILFFLQSLGLIGTITGLLLSHTIHSFPYAVRMVSAASSRTLGDLELAASVLGANSRQVFWRVTVPTLKTGISAAFLFSTLISINNVTIALFVSGSKTKTLPLVMFNMSEDAITPDLAAIATILTIVTVAVLLVLEKTVGVYGGYQRAGGN